MNIQQNLFQKGITSDMDNSIVANTTWSFPTQNIRIFNFDGQGYVATQVEGNAHTTAFTSDNIGFSLSSGFIALGSSEYNGVIYIISYNPTTNEGEVGSFPSPNWGSSGGKLYVYAPLKNLNTGTIAVPVRANLTSTAFNFDLLHPIYDEVQIVPSYDDSVDIIFTDFKNNIRIVNSGFKQDFTLNQRYLLNSELDSSMSLILQTEGNLNITFKEMISGSLPYGNIIFFARYADADFNKSLFVAESNAISIFKGSWNCDEVSGAITTSNSDKGVILTVSDIDIKYRYVQFGYIRYYSDETQVLLWDVKLIDKNFELPDDGITTTLDCTIYGNETTIDYTLDELIKVNIQERICKSINIIDNRLYGANWIKKTANHEYLETISSKIKIRYKQELSNGNLSRVDANAQALIRTDKTSSGTNVLESFADPFIAYEEMSYFHAEAYAFGIVWKWKNNNVSDVYNNLIGYDHFADANDDSTPNNNGIYRFPHVGLSDRDITSTDARVTYIHNAPTDNLLMNKTGIQYDFSDVITYLADPVNVDVLNWFTENIQSFAPVRAERNKNLLYQGLSLIGAKKPIGYVNINSAVFPAISRQYFPHYKIHSVNGTIFSNKSIDEDSTCLDFKRFGIYSPDYLLENEHSIEDDSQLYISMLYNCNNEYPTALSRMVESKPLFGAEESIWDGKSIYDQAYANFAAYLVSPCDIYQCEKVYNITTSNPSSNINKFCTNSSDFATGTYACLYDNHSDGPYVAPDESNRDLRSPNYIGVEMKDDMYYPTIASAFNVYSMQRKIVNVYKTDPNSNSGANIVNWYTDLFNTPYYKIGNYTDVALITGTYKPVFYRGDCFIQKTWFKQRTWEYSNSECYTRSGKCHDGDPLKVQYDPFAAGEEYGPPANNTSAYRYGHGALVGIITENRINSGLRVEGEDNTFYPVVQNRVGTSGTGRHVDYWSMLPLNSATVMDDYSTCTRVTGIESFIINAGYQRVLSSTPHFPYNTGIVYQNENLITRIRYTSRLVVGSYINQLRIFNSLSYKDYDGKYGPICAIRQLYNKLISVQQKTINEHIINERQTIPSSQGEILLGAGDILSQIVRRLADYGSDHNSSVKTTSAGIYGISSLYQTIWKADLRSSDSGSTFTGVTNLSGSKLISSVVNKYLELVSNNTSGNVLDTPLDYENEGVGLITGFDNKFKEVLFTLCFRLNCTYTSAVDSTTKTLTFLLNPATLENMNRYFTIGDQFYIYYSTNSLTVNNSSSLITITNITANSISWEGDENIFPGSNIVLIYNRTIVFNEKLDIFVGEYTISPLMYYSLNNSFYSSPVTTPYDTIKKVWQHNIKTLPTGVANSYSNFYSEQYPYRLSFIVNGSSEEDNSNMATKQFNNMVIEGTNQPFDKIEYYTKNQYALHDWSVAYERPWLDAEYIEDSWRIPIATQTSSTVDGYEPDANMKGKWMKVILTGTKTMQIFIKNVLTFFKLSNS